MAIQEMSVARISLISENFHIFRLGQRKHFPKCLAINDDIAKLERNFQTNNTLIKYLHCWVISLFILSRFVNLLFFQGKP